MRLELPGRLADFDHMTPAEQRFVDAECRRGAAGAVPLYDVWAESVDGRVGKVGLGLTADLAWAVMRNADHQPSVARSWVEPWVERQRQG